jgi:hypothetical protein
MAFPSDLVRTKNWGSEILTDSDLEGQFDLIINWVMAALNATTGHNHDGSSNNGPEINITNLTVSSQAQGDIIYASSASAWARLGYGTAGQVLTTGGASANPSWATPSGGILGAYKNLKVVRTNVTTVTVTADELILEDSSNNKVTIRSVSEAIAITTAGASGLDTGAEGSSRWYYIWIIRKSSDGTVNGLISESSSSPTMPSGYDQKALVSAVYNSSGSDFVDFIDEGMVYGYVAGINVFQGTGTSALSNVNTGQVAPANSATNKIAAGYEGQHSYFFPVLTANTIYYGTSTSTWTGIDISSACPSVLSTCVFGSNHSSGSNQSVYVLGFIKNKLV